MAKKKANKKVRKVYKLTDGVLYPIYVTGDTHVHITKGNAKLGEGVYNISLLPGDKPLVLKNGVQLVNIVGTCGGCCKECFKDCYAKKACTRQHNTCIPAWGENTVLAREDMNVFFDEIQRFLDRTEVKTFRVHVGGEFFSYEYMQKWNDLAVNNPDTTFYFYTKRYEWLEKLFLEDGLAVNFKPTVSIWHNNYANPYHFHEFIYDDGTDPELEKVFHCPAVNKEGHETGVTCAMCKRCSKAQMGMKTAVYAH